MDEAVRNLVASGADWTDAVHAASTAPARLLGRDDLGRLEPGAPAHVTVLDDDLRVLRTLVSGREALERLGLTARSAGRLLPRLAQRDLVAVARVERDRVENRHARRGRA